MQQSSPVISMASSNPNYNYYSWWNNTALINNTITPSAKSTPFAFSPSPNYSSSTSIVSPSLLVPPSNHNQNHQFNSLPYGSSSSSLVHMPLLDNLNTITNHHHQIHDMPAADSWSQFLMSGLMNENSVTDQVNGPIASVLIDHNNNLPHPDMINQREAGSSAYQFTSTATTSSPQSSCVTTFGPSTNLMEFSSTPSLLEPRTVQPTTAASSSVIQSSQCKKVSSPVSAASHDGGGGAPKKAKVQPSPSLSTVKVKSFADKKTNLHQLVSPFGKTDTASVLLEAIGYIRFLHSQIEALSFPYLNNGNGSANFRRHHHAHNVQREKSCLFPEDPGQLLNDNGLKRKAGHHNPGLSSRGLCLVPVSCTLRMGSENGADYWAPSLR